VVNGRILIVDDEASFGNALAAVLYGQGYAVRAVTAASACLDQLSRDAADVVVTDIAMPEMSGIDLCQRIRQDFAHVLPIVMTGIASPDVAIEAIRAGAFDYVTKPIKIRAFELAVARAVEHATVHRQLEALRTGASDAPDTAASSALTQGVLALVDRIADSDATVLISGESGSGKELVARTIHERSQRRDEPFIAINCGAMPAALLESELFGHVRGAFTHAVRTRQGLLLQAGSGTVLLDEIGDLPFEMQSKLLRVLQERRVRPIGGDQEVAVSARILAATHRDLEHEVAHRRFRKDLFYRINVVAIPVPALRERPDDILPLAHLLLRRSAARLDKPVHGITVPAARLLLDYGWPGNVRELHNYMERAATLCRLDQITAGDLPDRLRRACGAAHAIPGGVPDDFVTLDEMKSRYMRRVLALTNGNKSRAARILGIDRRTISNHKIERVVASDDAQFTEP
jgi:two-component system response regulator HydG